MLVGAIVSLVLHLVLTAALLATSHHRRAQRPAAARASIAFRIELRPQGIAPHPAAAPAPSPQTFRVRAPRVPPLAKPAPRPGLPRRRPPGRPALLTSPAPHALPVPAMLPPAPSDRHVVAAPAATSSHATRLASTRVAPASLIGPVAASDARAPVAPISAAPVESWGRIPLIYFMQVRAIIALRNDRPAPAAGTVVVRMHLRRDGSVIDVRLAQSSGVPALDAEAIDLVHRIGQFDPLPADAIPFVPDFNIDQPITFHKA